MDLHERYLRFPTLDISVLRVANDKLDDDSFVVLDWQLEQGSDTLNQNIEENIFVVPHHWLQLYNCEITKEKLNISKLEVYRMLLCYEYQQTFSKKKCNNKRCTVSGTKKIHIPSIETIFPAQCLRNVTEMSILRDIIILQMVLYCNTVSIKKHLQDFLNSYDFYIISSDTRTMYMKVLKYLLESLCLYQFCHNNGTSNKGKWKEISAMYLEVVKSWMKIKEDSDWGVFVSMFPMLVNVFVAEHMLFPLWDYTLKEIDDLKEILTVLSIIVDTCLTSSRFTKSTYIHRDIFCKNTFWLLLLEGLRSPLQQYRKQALYIMKRTIDIMSKLDDLHLESVKAEITPFICGKFDYADLPVDSIRQKFFLVYESLEEKQHHLVAPALTHIPGLVKASKEHESCRCFNIVWLQCILEKVIRHENNNIAKWGVSYVCKLDSDVFDDQFLESFINVLNNTFLYECQPGEDYPEIMRDLSTFFKCTSKGDTSLINRFIRKVSEINWGPVAIFYVMHTLRTTSQEPAQRENWRAAELNAVKSLVKKNMNVYSHVLRNVSQIELLLTIPNFIRRIDDLTLLANTLAVFSLKVGYSPWNIITTWLREVLTEEDAVAFVEQTCVIYSSEYVVPEVDPKIFSLMIYLLHDANFIFSCKSCRARNALNNWLSCLNDIEKRPYADIHSIINIAEFISYMMYFYNTSSSHSKKDLVQLIDWTKLYVHATFKFLITNVRKMTTGLTLEDYMKYKMIIFWHINDAKDFISESDVKSYVEKLQEESICLLKNTQQRQSTQYLYGMRILYFCQNINFNKFPFPIEFYTKDLLNVQATLVEDINNSYDADMMNVKGKIASEYYALLSEITYQYISKIIVERKYNKQLISEYEFHNSFTLAKLLTNLLKFIELGEMKAVAEVALILTELIDHKIIIDTNDWETFEYIFRSCWRSTFASKKNSVFWTTMWELVHVIINNNFFDSRLGAMEFISEFVDQLMKEGENAPRLKKILLNKIGHLSNRYMKKFTEPLLNCLLHGSILRRDERIEYHTLFYVIEHEEQYFSHQYTLSFRNNDAAVRALATLLLLLYANPRKSEEESDKITPFLSLIFETLEKYRNKRYFNDSYIHKLKHRLMQTLLVLEPIMSKENVALVQKKLQDWILSESNQHSVRLMQEWLMIRILIKNNDLHDELWKFFAESIEKRPGCTVSAASIVYHVAQLLPDVSQNTFIRTALPYLAQCCLGQQFNMRLYNQFILVRLYDLLEEKEEAKKLSKKTDWKESPEQINNRYTISDYKGIYQAAKTSLQQANSTKNYMKLQDNFYFSIFHPINDYSIQTIYFELPRLTNVSRDEWINPVVFRDNSVCMYAEDIDEALDGYPLKFHNVNTLLSNTITSKYLSKSSADDAESLVNNVEIYLEGLQNIQKKMNPSKFTVPLYNDTFGTTEESIHRQDLNEEGLIVVASFVNRPPNLGGIARTCEIFGVKLLVIANLDCAKDEEFQCLSVSAERWINILQVKPHELQQYLLEKKNIGWSLIGIEQTANSVNLLEAKFKKRTIFILGNEKDGIPANFIPLFDTCMQIPQMGVIRSLNVHVTAAICIWQYVSQHTLTS